MNWPAYAGVIAFSFSAVINLLVYRFHMWQEGFFDCSEKTEASVALRPAVAKRLPKDQKDKDDE